MTEPDHVRGICDIADCDGIACHAFRDEDADIYVEVCEEHVSSFDGFDSDYERVEHDSPHRSPRRTEAHACGGTLHIYDVPDAEEYRVCTDCGYALLIRDTEGKKVTVLSSPGDTEE